MRLHLPPRTIRARLTVIVFAAFLAAGAVLLAVTVVVWLGRTNGPTVALPSPSGAYWSRRASTASTGESCSSPRASH